MGIAQHHDAVSGTEKQHVADDYALRLAQGSAECKEVIDEALSNIIAGSYLFVAPFFSKLIFIIPGNGQSLAFTECPFLNQSICEATTSG